MRTRSLEIRPDREGRDDVAVERAGAARFSPADRPEASIAGARLDLAVQRPPDEDARGARRPADGAPEPR